MQIELDFFNLARFLVTGLDIFVFFYFQGTPKRWIDLNLLDPDERLDKVTPSATLSSN